MDVSNLPMEYYFTNTNDQTNFVEPMKSSFIASLDAIYVADPTYTVKPNCAVDLEFKGLWDDKTIHSMAS
jgi:hypothetical protein